MLFGGNGEVTGHWKINFENLTNSDKADRTAVSSLGVEINTWRLCLLNEREERHKESTSEVEGRKGSRH